MESGVNIVLAQVLFTLCLTTWWCIAIKNFCCQTTCSHECHDLRNYNEWYTELKCMYFLISYFLCCTYFLPSKQTKIYLFLVWFKSSTLILDKKLNPLTNADGICWKNILTSSHKIQLKLPKLIKTIEQFKKLVKWEKFFPLTFIDLLIW